VLFRKHMRGYQNRGATFIKRTRRCGLFEDMGLGKTIQVLTAIADLAEGGVVNRVLLVAPKRVAESVWRQEAKKWQHTKHLTFKLIMGNERKRLLALNSQAQVHIINVDNLRWLLRVLKSRQRKQAWPYDMLVVDESSMFKSAKAKRFNQLRYYVKRFDRRVILTGTPRPKSLLDIWSQMYIVDEGQRLGAQVERFRSRFFVSAGFKGYGYEPDEDAEEKIIKLISPVILTMRAEDYLELPPTLGLKPGEGGEVWVDLPPDVKKLYAKLEKEMFLELEHVDVEALNPAALSAKCWQLANGFIYGEDGAGERAWQAMHDVKLDAIEEVVEGVGGNVLVAYWFKPDLARLKKRFPKAPAIIEAKNSRALDKLVNEWNDGKHPVMFVHPQGAGHGLNLQFGGNVIAFYSMLWHREYYAQVIERIGAARQVSTGRDRVMVKHILARGTVDEVMLATQRMRHVDERRMMKLLQDYRDIKEILA
jgi:SNF2 family DNA or RNA helicase